MSSKSWHILNLIVFLVLLSVNLFIFLNRDNGYAYSAQASYNLLYHHAGENKVEKITQKGDTAFIHIIGAESAWREDQHGAYGQPAIIRLKEGKNLYQLESRKGQKISIGLNFTRSEKYIQNKRQRGDVLELYYSSAPVTTETLLPLSDWLYVDERATPKEKTQALTLISNGMHIGPAEKTEVKVLKTAAYILQFLDNKRGIPSQAMDSLSPLQRLNTALTGRSKVWCGDLASIFSYFMLLEGVPCRLIALEGNVGDALRAGHVFNEVYIKENQKWAMVDLTSKALLVKNENGSLLNCQQLFGAHYLTPAHLQLTTFNGQLLENEPYENVKGFYDYYFQSNGHFVYYLRSQFSKTFFSTPQKLRRYFIASPTYLIFDNYNKTDNILFFIKQAFALILVLFMIYWLFSFLLTRKKAAI